MAKQTRRLKTLLLITTILLLTLACNLPKTQKPNDFAATCAAQTLTAIIPKENLNQVILFATQTAQANHAVTATKRPTQQASASPTHTNPPTASPQPTDTTAPASINPTANARQVQFLQGGTSAYYQGNISSSQKPAFILSASEDQTMIVSVSSSDKNVHLDIQGVKYGQHLLSESAGKSYWSGTLPNSQYYLITLSTTNPQTDYFLHIEIPANILFDRGENSLTIDGYITVDDNFYPEIIPRVRYLVYAFAGQTMTIEITSPNIENLSLGIYGQSDGQPYKRYEVKGTSGSFELPQTQGYTIDVYSMGVSTEFTLKVTIE